MNSGRRIAGGLVALGLGLGVAAYAAAPKEAETAKIMHGILQSVQSVLPLSFNSEKFSAPPNRSEIQKSLDHLAENAAALQAHAGREKEPMFEHASRRLKMDAERTRAWYKNGRYAEARFYLHNLTENCISCHSKLPAARNFPASGQFYQAVAVKDLTLADRAWFQVVSREFDGALASYEEFFKSSRQQFSQLLNQHEFADYLKVAIRVKQDFKRPLALVKELAGRKNNSKDSRQYLNEMSAGLKKSQDIAAGKLDPLEKGRQLVKIAAAKAEYPLARNNLPYYVTASAFLNQYLDANPKKSAQLAEAYYLLGKSELVIGRSFWLSETEEFWELAIRTAPKSKWAKEALKELKSHLTIEYSGSGGNFMPEDVKTLLKDLEHLVKSNGAKRARK